MATCPRCHGALSEGHRCRPIWVRIFIRRAIVSLVGGAIGSTIQVFALGLGTSAVPVMGFVIGGLLTFGLFEAMKPE